MDVCGQIYVSQDRNQCQARGNMGCIKLLYNVNMTASRTPAMAFIYCTACYTLTDTRISTLQGPYYCPAATEGSY
jgi:hypothetical protein